MNRTFFSNLLRGALLYNRFLLRRCLYAGENGGVYLCTDTHNQSEVALKIFSAEWLRTATGRVEFEREVGFAFDCKHYHVVESHECFIDDDFAAFSMEYAAGGSLQRLLEHTADEGIRTAHALQILDGLAAVLDALHRKCVLHGALRPDNVLLSHEGEVKLSDFGAASRKGEAMHGYAKCSQKFLPYVSPESYSHNIYDERSEIYSVGLLAYELLCGKKPFHGTEQYHESTRAPSLFRNGKRLSSGISTIVQRCLDPQPDARYQSATELRQEILILREFGCSNTSIAIPSAPINSAAASSAAVSSAAGPQSAAPTTKQFSFPSWE